MTHFTHNWYLCVQMEKEEFNDILQSNMQAIEEFRYAAHIAHDDTHHLYDGHPYSHHLSMVADAVMRFGHDVIENEADVLPVMFAAFFHDSIEDARMTYNDVTHEAEKYMSKEQAFTAAEIVYAVTNDKGRTRAERAGEKYYAGIRETPFAPFIKLCDRHANMVYSFAGANESNNHMHRVYQSEWPHFLGAITVDSEDKRFALSPAIISEIEALFEE